MKVKNGIRLQALVLVTAMVIGTLGSFSNAKNVYAGEEPKASFVTEKAEYSEERLKHNYTHVSGTYTAAEYSGKAVEYDLSSSLEESSRSYLTNDTYNYKGSAVKVKNGDKLTLTVDVPESAVYSIGFDYLSYDASILPIEFALKIDGEYSFYEMRSLSFETTWVNRGEVSIDRYGNQIVTMPDKLIRWEHKEISDSAYRYSQPLSVELGKGRHSFEIEVCEGSFLLGNITLSAPVHAGAHKVSQKASGNELIVIEGEDFYERNDSSIHAVGEYDTRVTPVYTKEILLNTVDEDSFSKAGQRITWQFEAKADGYYNLALNYRQSEKNGFPVFADIRFDNELPDEMWQSYPLEYSANYTQKALKDNEGNNLSVYLTKGTHTVSVTLSADPIRFALEAVDEIMSGINDLSLEVTKVVGSTNDISKVKYRDIKLDRYIPDIKERLTGWVQRLNQIALQAGPFVGAQSAEDVAAFSYLLIAAKQLATLAEKPNELVYRAAELSTSTNSINTQIANFVDIINKHDLAIDKVIVFQEGAELPKAPGFFKSIGLKLSRFFNSFFGQAYSASNTDPEHIQVWVNRPRQYVEIMQKLIDERFTPETGIEVDLALMTDAQKLILSNASGDTPDIATGINYSIPFEMAIRGALVDLTKFSNYKEVFGRYSDGILVPSVIGDGLYSLPETMNFYVTFYRTDIFDKLHLSVPDTYDELVAILPDLQMRGLNVFYPTAAMQAMRNFHGVTPIIFQNGGTLYGRTAQQLTMDSEKTVKGFAELTDLFTLYNMPKDVPNFYQHFRNGDLALGIADFNSYNLILNAAPEIENSWAIAPVIGVKDPDTNEVHRYMSGGAESTVMFASNDEREQRAWKFMDWWSTASVQAEFGQMLQIMYGDEYIWPSANLEAFKLLPYPSKHKEIILEQAEQILEAPRLLGSYMLERELSNAFVAVVVDGESVRSAIDDMIKIVNRETARKLEEFEYIDSEGNVLKEYIVPSVEQVRAILER